MLLMFVTLQVGRSMILLDPEENNENESVRGAGMKHLHKSLRVVKFEDMTESDPVPVALSANINHQIMLNSNLGENTNCVQFTFPPRF